jgi:8-oxo-dGTP pyrophosphatase MutT (NUDIX family)
MHGDQPEHACAIIADRRGRLLLQLRPATARHAPGQLVCFGGKREPHEDAGACLARELAEELGMVPELRPGSGVELRKGPRFIALFTAAPWPDGVRPRPEPGFVAVWAPWAALPGLPLSPWHARVLAAAAQGRAQVDLLDADPGWPRLPP